MDAERMTIQDQLTLNRYQMPDVHDGAVVMWYPTGVPNQKRRELAWVRSHSQRGVNLYTSTGRRIDTVRHITDPRLQLNADQRENGAWDFVEDYLALQDLLSRVKDLERQVTAIMTGTPVQQPRKRGRPRKDQAVKQAVDNVVTSTQVTSTPSQ